MLTGLSIGNFKAFGKTQRVPLKPITLVFGPNSSGKSSLIHSVALSHDLFEQGDVDVERVESSGGSIELGGFAKYVYKRDVTAKSTLSFEVKYRYAEPEDSPYCVTLTIGIDAEQQKLAVLQYVATTREGKLFELEHREVDRKPALIFKNVNKEHPSVNESISHIFRNLLQVDIPNVNTKQAIYNVVDYAASCVGFKTASFLTTSREGSIGFGYNTPIQLYLLAAFSTSEHSYSWLCELTDKAVKWEEGRTERREERRRKQNEASSKSDKDPGIRDALMRIVERQEELEETLPPFNDFHSAVSYALADEDEKEDLYRPEFMMEESEAAAFYSGIDPYELQEVYDEANRLFSKLIDTLRLQANHVSDVLVNDYVAGISEFTYIGPIRAYPSQIVQKHEFRSTSEKEPFWDYLSVNRMDQVNKWLGSDFLNTHYRIDKRELFTLRGAELEKLLSTAKTLDDPLEAKALLESSAVELVLTDLRNDTEVDIRAVGVGISQVLPVLLSCFEMSEKFIVIEQPEIHLHPALQAELGDVFIESAKTLENRFILETHSEHLILRLLRRIRETTNGELSDERFALRPEDVAVLYVQPGENGAEIFELRVDEQGEFIDKWPDGFFAERARELF